MHKGVEVWKKLKAVKLDGCKSSENKRNIKTHQGEPDQHIWSKPTWETDDMNDANEASQAKNQLLESYMGKVTSTWVRAERSCRCSANLRLHMMKTSERLSVCPWVLNKYKRQGAKSQLGYLLLWAFWACSQETTKATTRETWSRRPLLLRNKHNKVSSRRLIISNSVC